MLLYLSVDANLMNDNVLYHSLSEALTEGNINIIFRDAFFDHS